MRKHTIIKFRKTNQGTSINLKPIVRKGIEWFLDKYYQGYATQNGELALGRNLKLHLCHGKGTTLRMRLLFLKVVRDDIFTSIHVDDYSLEVRDTKLGNEELTNDIPTFLKRLLKT
jgi:DNA-directed RNA polymerase subunit beta